MEFVTIVVSVKGIQFGAAQWVVVILAAAVAGIIQYLLTTKKLLEFEKGMY